MSNFTETWKKRINDNATRISLTGTVVAIIGCAYLYGKTKGEMNIELFLQSADETTKLSRLSSKV